MKKVLVIYMAAQVVLFDLYSCQGGPFPIRFTSPHTCLNATSC